MRFDHCLSAILLLTTAESLNAFTPAAKNSLNEVGNRAIPSCSIRSRNLFASLAVYSSDDQVSSPSSIEMAISNVTNTCLETLSDAVNDENDEDENSIALRNQKVQLRSGPYRISLPLTTERQKNGLSFKQVKPGWKLSDEELDIDSLEIKKPANINGRDANNAAQNLENLQKYVDDKFRGVVAHSVEPGGKAWEAGVRVGDILLSSSGIMGEALWPRNTLADLKSAHISRKSISKDISFEFKRVAENVANQYELTLSRPLGFQVKDTEDGFVEVTGFRDDVSNLVKYAIQVGDRVVAVENALGSRMWPVSTVDGVISACTSRLPGQPVKIRFERPQSPEGETSLPVVTNEKAFATTMTKEDVIVKKKINTEDPELLLKRCRKTLRRFALEENADERTKYLDKFSLPALVADKVMDALSSAAIPVDYCTLSMIMGAYLSCGRSDGAIRAFELATGLNGNGSSEPSSIKNTQSDCNIVPRASALNLYTASALLQAHAMEDNFISIERVLAAMEGRHGHVINNHEVAHWPETGESGSLIPDTKFYNIAMVSTARAGGSRGLTRASDIFNKLSEPNENTDERVPSRNLVSYNTIISAMAKQGKFNEAISTFMRMKEVGVNPDKFTYTTLIRACVDDDDVQELLYDMESNGVEPDMMTYNTMVKLFCDRGKVYEAKEVITEMEGRGHVPDSKTYGLLMKGLIRANNPEACLSLFESACADMRTSATMESVHLYTTAITAAKIRGDEKTALDLISRMNAIGLRPNTKTLTALIGACLSGNKPELAVQLYEKIKNPDGYAMLEGLRAKCMMGDLEAASSILYQQRKGKDFMSGKQRMKAYSILLETALQDGNYISARSFFKDLLQKNYIPAKWMMLSIIETLGFVSKNPMLTAKEVCDEEQFRFLLFILDSMRKRNLDADASTYAATISCGNILGGIYKQLASLLITARSHSDTIFLLRDDIFGTEKKEAEKIDGWEELLTNYDDYRTRIETPDLLPSLVVRIGAKETQKVFTAEKGLAGSLLRRRGEA